MEVNMFEACSMMRLILAVIAGVALAASFPAHAAVRTIVLVHSAVADGSGSKPKTSLETGVAATRRVLDKAGPCVLVGHSYGGMIITGRGGSPHRKSSRDSEVGSSPRS